MWYTILALLCLVIVILWNPVFEHMTNAAVQKKHDYHNSKPTKWEIPNAEDTKEKIKPKRGRGNEVYGPKVPPMDPNAPKPSSDTDPDSKMMYPDIYGPEVLTAPGGSKKEGDDSSSPLTNYDFVPAAEFPAGPSEPAPFLNDFSKILKM